MDWNATRLSEAAGISFSHARKILSGDRNPSLAVAFTIYDTTGLKFGILSGLDEAAIDQLRSNMRQAA
jgi:transcriptional regulator with XRE-family HTH domain